MKSLKFLAAVAVLFTLPACSLFSSGADDADAYGEGNIPMAGEGSELKDVSFEFDSSALDSAARGNVEANAEWLKANEAVKVVVEGHCDERGTSEYNLALGERRAQSVFSLLRELGVAGDRLSTISYGEELPLDPGHDEAAWAKNRRAHFAVSK